MQSVRANRILVFALIAVGGCLLDLWTKYFVFAELGMPGSDTHWLIDGIFGFQTSLNEGALFGMGQGFVWFFATMSVVASIGILVWLFYFKAAKSWLLTIALAMVTAGIFGNLYDRVGMPGLTWNYANPPLHEMGEPVYAVRDWIRCDIGSYTWPNFNIADSLLVCGALLLAWHAITLPPDEKKDGGGKAKDGVKTDKPKKGKKSAGG